MIRWIKHAPTFLGLRIGQQLPHFKATLIYREGKGNGPADWLAAYAIYHTLPVFDLLWMICPMELRDRLNSDPAGCIDTHLS